MHRIIALFALSLTMAGCASYVTPGGAAPKQALGITPQDQKLGTDSGIAAAMEKKPLAAFPASVAVVRVQAAGYRTRTAYGVGTGEYSGVTLRDVESETDVAKLAQLPQLRGLAVLNPIVLPPQLQTDYELRLAAARVHADMLLVYTIDTQFLESDHTTPLSVITLGATTTKNLRILSTVSAALLDTRSGYVYGLADATKSFEQHQNAWKTDDEVDRSRRKVEGEAFAALVTNLQTTWSGIVREYAAPTAAASAADAPAPAHTRASHYATPGGE
jgi:hypothetical protein